VAAQREWFEKDYYKTLGVSSTATDKELTSAYRKLAKQHHPDTNPASEDKFKEISAAYDVLGDAGQAQGVRRGPSPRASGPVVSRIRRVRRGRPPSGSRTWATSATSSAALFGGGRRGAEPPDPSGAPTSRPSSTCRSRTPSAG
jgi:hypothetical protein